MMNRNLLEATNHRSDRNLREATGRVNFAFRALVSSPHCRDPLSLLRCLRLEAVDLLCSE